jgi:hypothetical protein
MLVLVLMPLPLLIIGYFGSERSADFVAEAGASRKSVGPRELFFGT